MHLQQKVQRYGSLLLSKSSTLQFHMRLITAGLPHCVQINDTTLRTPRSGLHSDPPLSGLSPSPLLSPPFVLPWSHPPLSSVWWGFDLAWVPPLPLFVLPSHFGCRPFCVPVAFRSLSFLCPLCSRFVVVCSWGAVLLCWCRFGLGSSFSLAPSLSLSVLLFLWAPFSPCPPSSLSLAVYCGVPRCCLPYVKTRERRGSSFSQLGLEPNHTGLTAQSLFFLEESCRVKRSDTQTSSNFSNYFKRVLKLQKRSSSFSK